MTETAYSRLTWRGKKVNARTRDALKHAEKLWRQRTGTSKSLELAQGSYNKGVSASAGTHDGGGVVDIRTRPLTTSERQKLVVALKDSGFAAWYRDHRDGMDPHIHAIAIGDKEMAPGAKNQVTSFDQGRNGLKNNAKDRGTYRPEPRKRFSYAKGRPVSR